MFRPALSSDRVTISTFDFAVSLHMNGTITMGLADGRGVIVLQLNEAAELGMALINQTRLGVELLSSERNQDARLQ